MSAPDRSGGDEREIEAELRARSFTVAQHITGEKRPVVFLDVALDALARVRGVRDDSEGVLTDFCAYLEVNHGLKVRDSWAAMVEAFLSEYDERSPQGEDHEAGIEAAEKELISECGHTAPFPLFDFKVAARNVVAAYLSHSSPDALLVRQRDDWKHRAEMLQAEAERWREMAPEALVDALRAIRGVAANTHVGAVSARRQIDRLAREALAPERTRDGS